MKKFAMDKGVTSGDIFMNHAVFSKYESLYRAKEMFEYEYEKIGCELYSNQTKRNRTYTRVRTYI